MTAQLEGRAREILDAPNYVTVSIARPDGSIQSVVVWAAVDGENVAINSSVGRGWPANLQRAGRATVLAMADGNPYEWVSFEGEVTEATTDGADEHIDSLAKKYLGVDSYPFRTPDEQRIRFTLSPTRIRYQPPQG
jgi:PPOX class probable F420-dependent enzyme